eukprot:Polyplicarium_translucidae@DN1801_c0_g1_i1.p1
MTGPQSRKKKKHHAARTCRDLKKRGKDADQIFEAFHGPKKPLEIDEDLPGRGQFYCLVCDRHFIDDRSLTLHSTAKDHKRRLKEYTQRPPYTHRDSELAAEMTHETWDTVKQNHVFG